MCALKWVRYALTGPAPGVACGGEASEYVGVTGVGLKAAGNPQGGQGEACEPQQPAPSLGQPVVRQQLPPICQFRVLAQQQFRRDGELLVAA